MQVVTVNDIGMECEFIDIETKIEFPDSGLEIELDGFGEIAITAPIGTVSETIRLTEEEFIELIFPGTKTI